MTGTRTMAALCPDCGDNELITDFTDGRLVLVCPSCGSVLDPQAQKENESCQSYTNRPGKEEDPDHTDGDSCASRPNISGKRDRITSEGDQTAGCTVSILLEQSQVAHCNCKVEKKENTPTVMTCTSCKGINFVTDHETDRLVCEDCGSFADQPQVSTHHYTTEGASVDAGRWSGSLQPSFANDSATGASESKDWQQTQDRDQSHASEHETVINEEQTSSEAPPRLCGSCGGSNLVHDVDHGADQWVCDDCGFFTEKQQLVSTQDYTNIGGSTDVYRWTPAPKPRFASDFQQVNKGKESGEKTIKDIAARLSWRSDLTDQAVILFDHVYRHKQAIHRAIQFKDALGVACVYSVARENGVKVTLRTLIGFHNVKKKLITRALNLLKIVHQKPLASQTVSSLPEHILAPGNFSTALLDKISKLVNVCEKGFVSQGRDHANVVISVAHLAWVSEDVPARKSVKLPLFCSQHRLPHRRHTTLVQKDVKELFITLVGQLPWISTPVGKKTFLHYLDQLASYGQTMVSKAMSQGPNTVTAAASVNTTPGVSAASPAVLASPSSGVLTTAARTLPPLAPPSMRTTKGPKVIDPSQLLMPPHLTAHDLDSEVLRDTEFSDQEISSYILTPEETQVKMQMTKFG